MRDFADAMLPTLKYGKSDSCPFMAFHQSDHFNVGWLLTSYTCSSFHYLIRFFLRGEGNAAAITSQQINPIGDIPHYSSLPTSYRRHCSGDTHHKMGSNQDPQSDGPPTGCSELSPVHCDKRHVTSCDMPGCDGSHCLHGSYPSENADRDTSSPSMQSADSIINEETLFKQDDSSLQSLSPEESFCAAAMAKQYSPKGSVYAHMYSMPALHCKCFVHLHGTYVTNL